MKPNYEKKKNNKKKIRKCFFKKNLKNSLVRIIDNMSYCSLPLKERKSWLVVMTCILDFCRHLVCISRAMWPPATAFSTTKNHRPIGGAESFGGTLELFVKCLELGELSIGAKNQKWGQ
jgi:hypothetical protein